MLSTLPLDTVEITEVYSHLKDISLVSRVFLFKKFHDNLRFHRKNMKNEIISNDFWRMFFKNWMHVSFIYWFHKNQKKFNLPKNNKLTKNAAIIMKKLPKINIVTKSAVRPLNEFSSSIRQYRYVKIILKKKLKPNVPKNRKVVTSRHIW